MQTASGDTVDAIQQQMGTSMSEEAKAALRHEMGLDQPFIIQYFSMGRKNLYREYGIFLYQESRSLSHVHASFAQHSASNVILHCDNHSHFHTSWNLVSG